MLYYKRKVFYQMSIGFIVKKALLISVCCLLIACGGVYKLWPKQTVLEEETADQQTMMSFPEREVPANADLGSYLAGVMARSDRNIDAASYYYAKALDKDPQNTALQSDVYLISAFAGQTDEFIRLAQVMQTHPHEMFARVTLVTEDMKQGWYQEVLAATQKPTHKEMDALIFPIARAWAYAGLGEQSKAMKALEELTKDESIRPIYLYQKALLLSYFNNVTQAQKVYEALAKDELPAVTALLSIRQLYKNAGTWKPHNPMFIKYYETVQSNPNLGELLVLRADEFKVDTPQKGLAEAYYMISTVAGKQTNSPETGLLFNTLALYLYPDASVYKIWGAEQFESIKYYAEANRLYKSIPTQSDTILFKQALNLMLMEQNEPAEKILIDVASRQPNDILLLVMMGDLYRDTARPKEALTYYNRAIEIMKQVGSKDILSKTYLSRSSVYEALGQKDKMEQDAMAAFELAPDNPHVLNYLGYIWLDENKNPQQAMEYILKANQLSPDEPHIIDSVAWGYYKLGQPEKALEYAEKAADMLPFSSIVQSHLGDIYGALGRNREASYQYRKALELKADLTPALKEELEKKLEK